MGALSALFRQRALGAPADQWWPLVTATADRYGLDPHVLMSVLLTESSGNPNPPHVAGDGWGLMQVTESTAAWLGCPSVPDDLLDPATNVDCGARYLRYQLDRYGGDVASAVNAYRAGTASDSPRSQSYVARFFGFLESLVSGGIAVAAPSSDAATEAPSSPGGLPGTLASLTAWIGAYWPWLAGGAVVLYLARRR